MERHLLLILIRFRFSQTHLREAGHARLFKKGIGSVGVKKDMLGRSVPINDLDELDELEEWINDPLLFTERKRVLWVHNEINCSFVHLSFN